MLTKAEIAEKLRALDTECTEINAQRTELGVRIADLDAQIERVRSRRSCRGQWMDLRDEHKLCIAELGVLEARCRLLRLRAMLLARKVDI